MNEVAVIVCEPAECVKVTVEGNVIAYVDDPDPETVKSAAVTAPDVDGKVTPLVLLRVPAGANTTVPPVADCTAILPKFKSAFFTILMGTIIVAVAVAVAVACEKEARKEKLIIKVSTDLIKRVFIFVGFLRLFKLKW